jgi:hypothetical protein
MGRDACAASCQRYDGKAVTVLPTRARRRIMAPAYWLPRNLSYIKHTVVMATVLVSLAAPALAQQIPGLIELPANIAASNPDLVARRAALVQERAMLHGEDSSLRARCGAVEEGSVADATCEQDKAVLLAALNTHIQKSNDFNAAAQAAIAAPPSPAGIAPGAQIGTVAACHAAYMITPGGRQFPLQSGTPIPLNAHITTGPDGRFQVLLLDETVFTLGPNSDMVLDEFVYDPNTSAGKIIASLAKGTFRFVTGKIAHTNPDNLKVKVAVGSIGARGTDFETNVSTDGSGYVKLFTGQVDITESKTGAVLLLNRGEMVTFTADGTFSTPGPIPTGAGQ